MSNTLVLTPDMIDLIEKAGISLDKSLDNHSYQANILYQLQLNMNSRPKKYSVKDVKTFNYMTKQLKDDPAFTKLDDNKYREMAIDHLHASFELNSIQLHLSLMNFDSEEGYSKSLHFCQQRVSSSVSVLYLHFDYLSIDFYQKAFQLIEELI